MVILLSLEIVLLMLITLPIDIFFGKTPPRPEVKTGSLFLIFKNSRFVIALQVISNGLPAPFALQKELLILTGKICSTSENRITLL